MKTQSLFAATATIALMAGAAHAQEMDFATVDADASGDITYEELEAEASMTQGDFDSYDADADGVLSEDEFVAWQAEADIVADTSAGDGDMDVSAEEAEANMEAGLSAAGETPEAAENNEPTSEDDEALPAQLTDPAETAEASGAAVSASDLTERPGSLGVGAEDDQVSLMGSFAAIDADGSYTLSANEWSNWQAEDSANRTKAFAELDDDGSGRVVFTEFANAYDWLPVAAVVTDVDPVVESSGEADLEAEAQMGVEADADIADDPDQEDKVMLDDDSIVDEAVEDDPSAEPEDIGVDNPDAALDTMENDYNEDMEQDDTVSLDDDSVVDEAVEDDPAAESEDSGIDNPQR